MDPSTDLAAARLTAFLEREPVLWLSTVGPDGPSLVPTWFVWDGAAIILVSKPGARKVRNVAADPRVMIAVGDPEADFDVGMLQARAEVLARATPRSLPDGFAAKYGARIAALGLTDAQFAATYSTMVRLVPTRALGWHGRTRPASVVAAARRVAADVAVTIGEPGRDGPGWRTSLGEPFAGGVRRLARAMDRPGLAAAG
jgi:PPOX class probable F420-dependent enzyme